MKELIENVRDVALRSGKSARNTLHAAADALQTAQEERKAYDASVDAVESLKARLLKYESADGVAHGVGVPDVSKAARAYANRCADTFNVDREDYWKQYGSDVIEDVEFILAYAQPKPKDQGHE